MTAPERELLDGIRSWYALGSIIRPLAVLGDRIAGGTMIENTALGGLELDFNHQDAACDVYRFAGQQLARIADMEPYPEPEIERTWKRAIGFLAIVHLVARHLGEPGSTYACCESFDGDGSLIPEDLYREGLLAIVDDMRERFQDDHSGAWEQLEHAADPEFIEACMSAETTADGRKAFDERKARREARAQ